MLTDLQPEYYYIATLIIAGFVVNDFGVRITHPYVWVALLVAHTGNTFAWFVCTFAFLLMGFVTKLKGLFR